MQSPDEKRLFFGFEVHAPWPDSLPEAKTLKAKHRYMTLLYLGDTSYKKIRGLIPKMPNPSFQVGPLGISDASLCLPKRHPDVITWHVEPFGSDPVAHYQDEVTDFFIKNGYEIEEKKQIKHITLGRSATLKKVAKKTFRPLPLYFSNFHLYESLKGGHYDPIWTLDLLPPFEEVDKGYFTLYGESFQQIFLNAQIALAFKFPDLVPFLDPFYKVRNLHDGGIRLTTIINTAYREAKVPIESAFFPDDGKKEKRILTWDLIAKFPCFPLD